MKGLEGVDEDALLDGLTRLGRQMFAGMIAQGHMPLVIVSGSRPDHDGYKLSVWPMAPGGNLEGMAEILRNAAEAIEKGAVTSTEVDFTEAKGGTE